MQYILFILLKNKNLVEYLVKTVTSLFTNAWEHYISIKKLTYGAIKTTYQKTTNWQVYVDLFEYKIISKMFVDIWIGSDLLFTDENILLYIYIKSAFRKKLCFCFQLPKFFPRLLNFYPNCRMMYWMSSVFN